MALHETFRNDIRTALGGNLIDVELTQADYDFAFDKAKRIFQQRGNNNFDRKFLQVAVVPDTFAYLLPASDNIDTIIKIIKPKSGLSTNDLFSIATINEMFGSMYSAGSNSIATYELLQQSLDTINIYTLHDTQFVWKKRTNTLTLLDNPKVSENWFIEVYADLTDEEYEDVIWVRNYTIAEAKIILGSAYRKFQSLTSPSGETGLSGDQMIQEGKEEQLLLLEAIGDYVDGDITGSIMLIG